MNDLLDCYRLIDDLHSLAALVDHQARDLDRTEPNLSPGQCKRLAADLRAAGVIVSGAIDDLADAATGGDT